MGGAKARSVKNGLARLVEASILERYELTAAGPSARFG